MRCVKKIKTFRLQTAKHVHLIMQHFSRTVQTELEITYYILAQRPLLKNYEWNAEETMQAFYSHIVQKKCLNQLCFPLFLYLIDNAIISEKHLHQTPILENTYESVKIKSETTEIYKASNKNKTVKLILATRCQRRSKATICVLTLELIPIRMELVCINLSLVRSTTHVTWTIYDNYR